MLLLAILLFQTSHSAIPAIEHRLPVAVMLKGDAGLDQSLGGDMVESVLRGVGAGLPVKLVNASRSKAARAEPVAALFESGKARLAGRFGALEEELAGLIAGGGYEGAGSRKSPDRADAMVWAVSELARPAQAPRVLRF